MKYLVESNGRQHEVTVIERDGARISFEIEGVSYTVSVLPMETPTTQSSHSRPPPAPLSARPVAASAVMATPGTIVAPMPGLVAAIKVKENDAVTSGQVVAVIEAMKMENNITAPYGGTVSKIEVKDGAEVTKGQPLLTVSKTP